MKWFLWAFFGNDEDGPYGFYPHTKLGAVRWWLRNPCHNLMHHVLAWPGGPLLIWGQKPGYNGYIGFRKPTGELGFRPWGKD